MVKILKDFGTWENKPIEGGWITYKRINADKTETMWFDVANKVCPLDEIGEIVSSKYPFYVRIKDEIVLNCYSDIWRLIPTDCRIIAVDKIIEDGSLFIDGIFSPPPLTKKEYPPISRKQLSMWVYEKGIINFDEAILWATVGTLPLLLREVIDPLPDQAKKSAIFHLSASSQFERHHNLTSWVGYALSTSELEFDDNLLDIVWQEAYKL